MKTSKILSVLLFSALASVSAFPNPQEDVATLEVTTEIDVTTILPEDTSNITAAYAALAREIQEEKNKKLVLDFYQEVFGDKNVDAADKYIDEKTYIQHNPDVADGREAFKSAMKGFLTGQPKNKIDVQRIGADGDFVYLHLRNILHGKVASVMDIFRVENDKIVEHWDAIQFMTDKSANAHPLF